MDAKQAEDKRVLLENLQQNPVFQSLEELVRGERDHLVSRICGGRLSHDEYLALCGELRGLDVLSVPPKRLERPDKR